MVNLNFDFSDLFALNNDLPHCAMVTLTTLVITHVGAPADQYVLDV